MDISEPLIAARKKKKLKPAHLAKILGVGRNVVHAWEKGVGPRFEMLPRLAQVLDTTVEILLGLGKRR